MLPSISSTEAPRDAFLHAGPTPGRRLRITLAEDDRDLRDGMVRLLESEGYEVNALASGAMLVEHLAPAILDDDDAFRPDAIVTDVRMPGINGLSIVAGLRQNGWEVPIVVISAFTDDQMKKSVDRLGGAVLFGKPFDPEELKHTLASLILRALAAPPRWSAP